MSGLERRGGAKLEIFARLQLGNFTAETVRIVAETAAAVIGNVPVFAKQSNFFVGIVFNAEIVAPKELLPGAVRRIDQFGSGGNYNVAFFHHDHVIRIRHLLNLLLIFLNQRLLGVGFFCNRGIRLFTKLCTF